MQNLLAGRNRIHHLLKEVLTEQELHDALMFAAASTQWTSTCNLTAAALSGRRFDKERLMNGERIYDGFIALEERSAALYLELSVRFFENPELSWFWVEMAMEEKQHAGMLHHCREAGVFASELPDKDQIQRLNSLFRQLEARTNQPALLLDDAFEIAIELESSEINDIYSRLTAPIQGPAHVMRKKMELSVAGHFERLQQAARKFNASATIQTRLAGLLTSQHF